MNGKIDLDGILYIDRAGRSVVQMCKFMSGDTSDCCAHDCPHFGEPYKRNITRGGTVTTLNICQGNILEFENFKDERNTH